MKKESALDRLIRLHSDAKRMWDEEYDFEVKHRNIKFEERSARDSWERKRRKAANKIARLKREIRGLESDVEAYSLPRDSYQHRLDEAELHEDYLRVMFNETK